MTLSPHKHRLALAATLALGATSAHAADTPAPPTLAQALAAAPPPKSELYIAVNAEKVTLPKDAAKPAEGDTVAQIADEYGRNLSSFGTVTAIAPPTMAVVNIPPDKPNPYDGMHPKQLLKLLTSGFKANQWKAFMSESGVGYFEMRTADQRALFEALFPGGVLKVRRSEDDVRKEVSGDNLKQAHLRLAYGGMMALGVPGKPGEHVFTGANAPHAGPFPYWMENSASADADHEYGADVRSSVPSTPKPSDLGDDPALRASVSMFGLKTVDDVVRAAAAATGREIYADPRDANKSLTLLGPRDSVRALDILKALALCVNGAYRQVGPALVLTNDLIGLGTRRALWKLFEDKALAAAPKGSTGEPPKLSDDLKYTALDIPWTGNDVAASQQQQDDFWKKWRENPQQWKNGRMDLTLPFAELSPTQQRAALAIKSLNDKWKDSTTLDADVLIQTIAEVQIVLPALDAPVSIPDSYDRLLPDPPLTDKERMLSARREESENPNARRNRDWAPPPLKPLLAAFARRAVRMEQKSPEALKKDIAAMPRLGLNELWLQITPDESGAGDDAAIALLHQAVDAGNAAHLAVYPTFSIFARRTSVSDALRDRTLLGESSAVSNRAGGEFTVVTPFEPAVGKRLAALIGKAGRVPGIAGMVWENAVPIGYERIGEHDGSMSDANTLGYSVAGRLAYLRKAHIDPIDINDNYYNPTRAAVLIPDFDEQTLDNRLFVGWRKFRSDDAQAVLRWLSTILPASFSGGVGRLPLLAPPANTSWSNLYGSWDDFTLPSPTVEYIFPKDAKGVIPDGATGTERLASALIYRRVEVHSWQDAATNIALQVGGDAQSIAKSGVRNIVIDGVAAIPLAEAPANASAPNANAPQATHP